MSKEMRRPRLFVAPVAEEIEKLHPGVVVAGSVRRNLNDIGDIDVCIAKEDFFDFETAFVKWADELHRNQVKKEPMGILKGGRKNGIKIELYVAPRKGFGALLCYSTGSPETNIKMRGKATDLGYKLNQYGLWQGETFIAGETEESVYEALGMDYKNPEDR